MPTSYRDLSQPAIEPVTLAQVHSQLVLDTAFTEDDAYLSGLITAARQLVEQITNRAIYNRSMQLNLDYFPYPDYSGTVNPNDHHTGYGPYWHQLAIKLPKPSTVSVQSITYVDLSGTTQTLSNLLYYVDTNSEPARIVPIPGSYWPYTQNYLPGSVSITYTAGTYGDGVTVDLCPQTIKQAILMLVSYWYSHRDSAESNPPKEIDFSVRALLAGETFDTFGFN